MSSDRRKFLRQATAVTAGLGARAFPLTAQQRSSTMPTARAGALMAAFGLRYPIFCAGIGTVATPELAIAVSNGGGLGALGTGSRALSADVIRQRVSRTKSGTNRPFAVNYLLAFDLLTLPVALDAGAPIIQFAWGIPTGEAVAAIRKAGAKMGIQISSVAGALLYTRRSRLLLQGWLLYTVAADQSVHRDARHHGYLARRPTASWQACKR